MHFVIPTSSAATLLNPFIPMYTFTAFDDSGRLQHVLITEAKKWIASVDHLMRYILYTFFPITYVYSFLNVMLIQNGQSLPRCWRKQQW